MDFINILSFLHYVQTLDNLVHNIAKPTKQHITTIPTDIGAEYCLSKDWIV